MAAFPVIANLDLIHAKIVPQDGIQRPPQATSFPSLWLQARPAERVCRTETKRRSAMQQSRRVSDSCASRLHIWRQTEGSPDRQW